MQSSKALHVINSIIKFFIALKWKEATKPIYCTNGVDLRLWLTVGVPKSFIITCFSTVMCDTNLKSQYIRGICNSSCLCIYQIRRINIQMLLRPKKILMGGSWNKRKGASPYYFHWLALDHEEYSFSMFLLLILSYSYNLRDMSYTQWVFKIHSGFLVHSTTPLSTFSECLAWEQHHSFHLSWFCIGATPFFGHSEPSLFICCSSVHSWWLAGCSCQGLLCLKLCARSGSAVQSALLCLGSAVMLELLSWPGGWGENPWGEFHQWNPHLDPSQGKIYQMVWVLEPAIGIILSRTVKK